LDFFTETSVPTSIRAAVYSPPQEGLPFVAVVLKSDGEVLIARAVQSVAQGDALIAKVFREFAGDHVDVNWVESG
jgi:hypothetical protein